MIRHWCLALAACGACAAEPAPRLSIDLEIAVDDGAGQPVAGATIGSVGGQPGVTDARGKVALRLDGVLGQVVQLDLQCPTGTRAQAPPAARVVFRRLLELGAGAAAVPRQRVSFTCLPQQRPHLLVVRTDHRADLPVLVTGERTTATDVEGVAQLLLHGDVGDEIEVVIDTSSRPELRPAMPSRRLRLPTTSSFLIFDQRFSERAPERPRRRRSRSDRPRRL
jgi:hypothetical protein